MKLPVVGSRRICVWCQNFDMVAIDDRLIVTCEEKNFSGEKGLEYGSRTIIRSRGLRRIIRQHADCSDFEEIEE